LLATSGVAQLTLITGAYCVLNNLTIGNTFSINSSKQIVIRSRQFKVNNEVRLTLAALAFYCSGNITFDRNLGVNPNANRPGRSSWTAFI
jgi:hypothetical protein